MTWLRLHTDILSDPKLMRAAREGAKYLYLTPWLFAFAKQADDNGRLSVGRVAAEPRDIARTIPCTTPKAVRGCCRELQTLGVLFADDDGVLVFSRWESRQSKPSASPEAVRSRVQKHRSAHRSAPQSSAGVTPGNAPHSETYAGDVSGDATFSNQQSGENSGRSVTPHRRSTRGVTSPPNVTPPEERRGEEVLPTVTPEERREALPEAPEASDCGPEGPTSQEFLERKAKMKAELLAAAEGGRHA